ncbi:MAG: sterol desaturase family protein [Gammaproteobacteria bacterium]|nr:sterol desaturase family protein [Gammaproteobacteria bacterium]
MNSQEIHLVFGEGVISGIIALILAVLSFLGVLAFHFPEYLTTPELREAYDVDSIRTLMFYALILSGSLASFNIVRALDSKNRAHTKSQGIKYLGALSWGFISLTILLGAYSVEVTDFADNTPYIGLDWFILDLLGSSIIFITIEKMWPFRKQAVFRVDWLTDVNYFLLNHLLVGFMLLVTSFVVFNVFGWVSHLGTASFIQSIPFLLQLLLIVLFADLVQYWVHRSYHEIPFLWRFHAVHHSAEKLDWMAGSRQHILEIFVTRSLVLVPVSLLGFPKEIIDAYIIIVGLQAVFNHANVQFKFGWLQYIFVTPQFHHWHHSSDKAAIDKNYAAHFSFLDYLFKTAVKNQKEWPNAYGVVGNYVPKGLWQQQLFPFKRKKKK